MNSKGKYHFEIEMKIQADMRNLKIEMVIARYGFAWENCGDCKQKL